MILTVLLFLIQIVLIFKMRQFRNTKNQSQIGMVPVFQWFVNLLLWILTVAILLASSNGMNYLHLGGLGAVKIVVSLFLVLPFFLIVTGLVGFDFGNLMLVSVSALLAIGNFFKVTIRTDSIIPADLSIKQLIDMSQTMLNSSIKMLTIILSIVFVFLIVTVSYWFSKYPNPITKKRIVFQLALTIIGLVLAIGLYQNPTKTIQRAGIEAYPYNNQENTKQNGTIIHFYSKVNTKLMNKPEGYSKKRMLEIVNAIEGKYHQTSSTKEAKTTRPNVIFMLSEAFWDPTELEQIEWEKDPIPTIRRLIEANGGSFLSPEYGGNTANVEFNVMTGFSSRFINSGTVPYVSLSTDLNHSYSIVSTFKENKYTTAAIHPYKKEFYNRNQVFENFGFDQVLFDEEMTYKNTDGIGPYISDSSLIKEIEKMDKESKNPYFIHSISMQNHYPYTPEIKYGDEQYVKNAHSSQALEELNIYAQGINHTDTAIKNLLEYYQSQEKETYLVFYGDHLPLLMEETFDNSFKGATKENTLKKHESNYFVWSNKKNVEISGLISPNFLAATVQKSAGIRISLFQKFLEDLKNEVPALGTDDMLLEDSSPIIKVSKEIKDQLTDYELLQYDMLQGEQFSKNLFKVSE